MEVPAELVFMYKKPGIAVDEEGKSLWIGTYFRNGKFTDVIRNAQTKDLPLSDVFKYLPSENELKVGTTIVIDVRIVGPDT